MHVVCTLYNTLNLPLTAKLIGVQREPWYYNQFFFIYKFSMLRRLKIVIIDIVFHFVWIFSHDLTHFHKHQIMISTYSSNCLFRWSYRSITDAVRTDRIGYCIGNSKRHDRDSGFCFVLRFLIFNDGWMNIITYYSIACLVSLWGKQRNLAKKVEEKKSSEEIHLHFKFFFLLDSITETLLSLCELIW